MKVLILGATGMLGNAVLRVLSEERTLDVRGTIRADSSRRLFSAELANQLISGVDVEDADSLVSVLCKVEPDVVINCVGVVKQLAQADDPLQALPINALLPHRLAKLCSLGRARLVQISTDCVFDGAKGGYLESDKSDATDLYGKSKFLGEVDYPNAVTLRTSIIGHELGNPHSLVDWFLAQHGTCRGFSNAIFSGLPTVELARVIRDFVLPAPSLRGLYHVAAAPINKFELLTLVKEVYQKEIEITLDGSLKIDRSLDASRFNEATGYKPPAWPELIRLMHKYK